MQTHIQPKLPKNLVRKGSVWENTPTIIQFIYFTVDYIFIFVEYSFPESSIFCVWSPFI